ALGRQSREWLLLLGGATLATALLIVLGATPRAIAADADECTGQTAAATSLGGGHAHASGDDADTEDDCDTGDTGDTGSTGGTIGVPQGIHGQCVSATAQAADRGADASPNHVHVVSAAAHDCRSGEGGTGGTVAAAGAGNGNQGDDKDKD